MPRTVILGTGHYVPDRVVTNDDLAAIMTTSDEWIQQRTGIRERRHVDFDNEPMGSSEMGARAGKVAIEDAGLTPDDVDLIIYGTLSPDKAFPGDGCLIQAKLDIPAGVPALDVRNQCSAFLYSLQVADAFIKTGAYRRILLIGAETHSTGMDFSDDGRDVAVLFGDGAAAVMLGAGDDANAAGVLSVRVHADGRHADVLQVAYPSCAEMPRVRPERLESKDQWPKMNGKMVFKHAVSRLPETIGETLAANGLSTQDIDLLIPHQANLRINEAVQKRLALRDDQVFNNIQHYGNTTAASIPLALDQARKQGRVQSGDLLCFAAFGSGFTWGSALVRF